MKKNVSERELTGPTASQRLRADFVASGHGIQAALSFFRQGCLTAATHGNSVRRQGAEFARLQVTDLLAKVLAAVQRLVTHVLAAICIRDVSSARYFLCFFPTETS